MAGVVVIAAVVTDTAVVTGVVVIAPVVMDAAVVTGVVVIAGAGVAFAVVKLMTSVVTGADRVTLVTEGKTLTAGPGAALTVVIS